MYLNNAGIRKIALFFGVSAPVVLRWIKNAHKLLQELSEDFNPLVSEKADIIELDEIYTYVKKRKIIVWTAYSRRQKRVIAYCIFCLQIALLFHFFLLAILCFSILFRKYKYHPLF